MFLKFNALLLLLVTSVVSPLALAQPDSGLLISRANSQDWQIRLVGGTEAQQFSGVLESSMPFRYVRAATGAEGAQLTAPASLNVNLAADPGGSDQVNFAVSVDAKLCLRDTGSTDVKIYLGDSLSDAIPVTAPASLGGIDACGDATGASAATTTTAFTTSLETSAITTTAIAAGRKFHPGHYTALVRGQSTQAYMADSIKPGTVGLMKRYTWRSLEPTQGNYNFAALQSDLAWAKAHNMRLIAMIEDKTFKLERPTPAYLDSYTPRNRAGGYTVVRWNPYVVGRLNALIKAMGNKVDSHPNFEGIATQETSLSLDSPVLKAHGYTPEKYRDAYINTLTAASKSLPTSRVFWFMNFLVGNQAYLGTIADAVASKGVVLGGPDVMPDNSALVTKVYPYYDQFHGRMHKFTQVEPMVYRALHETAGYRTKYWTMPELFKYARDKLNVNYMFWVRMPKASPTDSYDWYDALPVISTYRTF